jgi:hypothetical protein
MEKYGAARQTTYDNSIWRLRITFQITKARTQTEDLSN